MIAKVTGNLNSLLHFFFVRMKIKSFVFCGEFKRRYGRMVYDKIIFVVNLRS